MKTHVEVSNSEDVIDSRDVIARIEELESLMEDAKNDAEQILAERAGTDLESTEQKEIYGKETSPAGVEYYTSVDFDVDEYNELQALRELADEASGSPDWTYGETLIRDSYFQEYAQQLAEDCGMIEKTNQWPNRCIDWEQAADELKQDYMSVDFDGVEY